MKISRFFDFLLMKNPVLLIFDFEYMFANEGDSYYVNIVSDERSCILCQT